jgi:C1A family cysteine protease
MAIKIPSRTIIDISQDAAIIKPYYSMGNVDRQRASVEKIITDKFKLPKFHWVKDKPDSRDYLYKLSSTGTPGRVDLRNFCTSIEDQGALGSCTGQAIASAIEYLNNRSVGRALDISRLFIYYYERALINTIKYDSGAYIRDGIKVVFNNGAPLESLWPYVIRRFTQVPSRQAINDALKRKVTRYERVTTLDGCINALSNGLPVIVGFLVYSSFMSRSVSATGIMPYPNVARERLLGGHAVLLVGFDNATQRFIAKNSWGTGWGDKGYFYMPYQVIGNRAMSDDFWVIRNVNNPR